MPRPWPSSCGESPDCREERSRDHVAPVELSWHLVWANSVPVPESAPYLGLRARLPELYEPHQGHLTIRVGAFTKRLRVRGDVEISCPCHERKRANIMVNTPLRRPTCLRNWTIAVAVVTALVTGLVLWSHHTQLNQERSEMANTKIVYVADPVQKLVQRTDGSYYKATPSHGTYYYTTIEDLIVVPRSVSAEERRAQPSFLWHHSTITNHITVRIIDPHEADRTPRLERERCTVKPIDPTKPSYTGNPHARGRLKIGPDQEDTDVVILSGLFSDDGQQLCQDRITLLVPDGGIQP